MREVTQALEKADPRFLEGESLAPTIIVDASRDTFNFLEEVAVEITYSRFFGRCKVQLFERLRALAISDVFEDVTDEARTKLVKPYTPEQIRGMDVYLEVKTAIEMAARRIAGEESPQDFLARVGMRSARALERVARRGSEKERGKAAAEIFERQIPKMPRTSIQETKVIVLSDKSAKVLREAFGES